MSVYIHGTDDNEQRRLSLMNDVLLNSAMLREMNLRGYERILDLGSGLGQFTRMMARAVPNGHVVGIEYNEEQLGAAKRLAANDGETSLADFRSGDALNLDLGNEWGTFDVAHTRFLLEHISDPLRAVKSMVRAVRPGGRIVLADDDHGVLRLWPEPPGWMSLWDAYMRAYDAIGNDPLVGRRLVQLLHEAGAQPVRNTWVFFGAAAPGWRPSPSSPPTWPASSAPPATRSCRSVSSMPATSTGSWPTTACGRNGRTPRYGFRWRGRKG